MHILIVTRRALELAPFADALAQDTGLALRFTDGWVNAQATLKTLPPAFMVLDEGLRGGPPLKLVKELIQVNAMVNIVVVSDQTPEAFHDASEGLGILAQVPVQPTVEDGAALAELFRRFM
ncbi:MAG: hypothetical protein RDU24_06365 [Humidesulfovibrio sp.]|uniref:hypothetical protein n=1 Tax=Humidesulfovibrio sp. TaxID=2910988 RepID=UPI0027FF2819|nr:hypothetical protein [Humidesulfovibrio sp.]MDQ7834989.1 hypothetical protein [Humidesulfovibrio sp.]